MALGSSTQQAVMDVGSSGASASSLGIVLGLALSFVVMRVLQSEIYGVREYDP